MTVKELTERLQGCRPDDKVYFNAQKSFDSAAWRVFNDAGVAIDSMLLVFVVERVDSLYEGEPRGCVILSEE